MICDYITVKMASQQWGVSTRRIYALLEDNRIAGAKRIDTVWLIPASVEKPRDNRFKKQKSFRPAASNISMKNTVTIV